MDNTRVSYEPGMIIQAKTDLLKINIEATGKFTRKYSWGSNVKEFTHTQRWDRWYGSKGMYCPSGDSEMHAVLEEGQQHFFSEDDVYLWLRWKSYNGRRALVYTSDGLVVLWEMQNNPSKKFSAISVDVWQIYIQGKNLLTSKGLETRVSLSLTEK